MPTGKTQYYLDILQELDCMDTPVSDWEAEFIKSIYQKAEQNGFMLSEKQMTIIDRMRERYLV